MDRITNDELYSLLHTVINATPSILLCVDRSGRIVFWNEIARQMSTVDTSEACGRLVSDVLPFMQSSMNVIRRAIESGQVQRDCRVSGIVHGVTSVFEVAVYPYTIADGNETRGAAIRADASTNGQSTDRNSGDTAHPILRRGISSQMAHEINNYLAGVLQNIQVIKHRLLGDSPKNRTLAEESGTTFEAIKTYIERRNIVPMIEAALDSGNQAVKAVATGIRTNRLDSIE